jgi:hypothetical protein
VARDLNRTATAFAFWGVLSLAMLTTCAATMPQGCSKSKAYITAMKSDLRNLHAAQEAYRSEHSRFAHGADITDIFRSSTGVRLVIEHADETSWRARTTHAVLRDAICTISSTDDQPRCTIAENWRRPRWSRNSTFNVAIDLWLFAFTLRRRQRRLATQQQLLIRIITN